MCKNISKLMAVLCATAVVGFSFGTASACVGGAEGTKGCTSGVSYGTSYSGVLEHRGDISESVSEGTSTSIYEVGTEEAYDEGEENTSDTMKKG